MAKLIVFVYQYGIKQYNRWKCSQQDYTVLHKKVAVNFCQ